jgi:hypothetical protein
MHVFAENTVILQNMYGYGEMIIEFLNILKILTSYTVCCELMFKQDLKQCLP